MADNSITFWVGTSSTMARIARIDRINSATINMQLNNAGSVQLVLDRSDPAISNVSVPITNCLLVYRDGTLVWSGPVWTVDETHSGESKKITITAIGWFELLNHRLIRSTPGYTLGASSLSYTNGTFEAGISGYTTQNGTAARDTVVFQSGAGSLRLAENVTTGLWTGSPLISYLQANALSGTPTAGKRYQLYFSARARRDARYVNGIAPYLEILESGTRVGFKELGDCFVGNGFIDYYTTTGAFFTYTTEWVSSGVAPTFRFAWDVNPTQFYQWDGSGIDYWTVHVGSISLGSGAITISADGSPTGYIEATLDGTTGELDPAKSYTCAVTYMTLADPLAGDNFYVQDSLGTILGTSPAIGSATVGVWTTSTFTFTPTSLQPCQFYVTANTWGFGTRSIVIDSIVIRETNTNTDNLLNVDNITLQEYTGDGIYSNQDAGAIAMALLNKANSDGASKITPGSIQTTQPRTRTYQQFSNVGKEIKALSEIESGYDFVVDPITRVLNIYNRTNATNFPSVLAGQAGVGSWTYSANRTSSLRFDYGIGKDNLSSVNRKKDSSTVVNRLNVKGKYALGFAQDTSSQSTNGIFEDLISLPDVIDASTSILPYYANAEVAFKKNPKISYDIQVKPGSNSPSLFIDFNIGDRGTINVGTNILSDSGSVSQTIRIFGVQLSIDAEGNERISGLQLVA